MDGKLDQGKRFLYDMVTVKFVVYRCTYKDPENRAVLDCLLREVKALNPSYITEHIKGIYRWLKGFIAYSH